MEPLAKLGKYRLLKQLAKGGMGEVYLAKQEGMRGFSKMVVVKRILEQYAADRGFAEMFTNEARLAALLTHPNVAQVYDLGEEEGSLYLAMEFVHGHSLRGIFQQLQKRKELMPPVLAARLAAQALHGLHHAHTLKGENGQLLSIVHRDVSPDNLLVGYDGVVKVVDFGIAKATALSQNTQTGVVKGKLAYMPPEQLEGKRVDARTDVYAMGVVLYEMLCGKRPFKGNTDTSLIMAIMREPIAPLRSVNPAVPAPLEGIAERALQKNPAARFADAEQMSAELDEYASSTPRAGDPARIRQLLVDLFGSEAASPPVFNTSFDHLPAVVIPTADVVLDSSVTRSSAAITAPTAPALAPVPGRGMLLLAAAILFLGLVLLSGMAVLYFGSNRAQGVVAPVPAQVPALVAVTPPVPIAPAPVAAPAPSPPVVEIPPPPIPAPVAVAKTGHVDLVVLPWGEVSLGKRVLGVTPMSPVLLPAGVQMLTVKNPDLKVERRVRVNVPAGGTVTLKVNLME